MNSQLGDRYFWVSFFPIIILCYTFSLLWGWVPLTHSIITLVVGWVVCLMASSKYFSKTPTAYLLVFAFVLFINVLMGDHRYSSYREVFEEITKLTIPALMFYGIVTTNTKVLKNTVVLIIVMLIVNAIGTAFVDTMFPGSIRALNFERKVGNTATQMYFFRYGVANYSLPHALPAIIPVLVMGIKSTKQDKRKRLVLLSCLIACIMLIYFSGAATAAILGILALLMSLLTLQKIGRGSFILLIIVGLLLTPIIGNDKIILSFLNWIDSLIGYQGYFHGKIIDFQNLLLYDESSGDVKARQDLYMITINAIIDNPLLGSNEEIGGHSTLLDHWGDLGLLGFIPYLLFIGSQIKLSLRYIPKESKMFYFEGVFFAFMMLLIKHMNTWDYWLFLFLVLPLLSIYCQTMSTLKHRR